MQRGVAGAPFRVSALGLLWGQGLRVQPGIIGVLRPDLDVRVADDAPVLANGRLGDLAGSRSVVE